jgi:hypothetical protein
MAQRHFKEFFWQQPLAGALRALGADEEIMDDLVEAIYRCYGRTNVFPNGKEKYIEWVTGENTPPQMVGEVEALLRKYMGDR